MEMQVEAPPPHPPPPPPAQPSLPQLLHAALAQGDYKRALVVANDLEIRMQVG